MGTWGAGNFDSDTAADHVSGLSARLRDEIAAAMAGDPVELEPDEYWGTAVPCNVEILAMLAEQRWVGVDVPDLATVTAWKATYLGVWRAIDELGPSAAWKKERRAVIAATFDRLAKECRRRERPAKPAKKPTAKSAKKPAAKPAKKPAKKR